MLKVKVNEVSIAYERRGKGMPLVLLHGYPLDHTIWEPVAAWLENDFDLILPDLRGFGESDAPKANYSMADLADDLAGILDQAGIQKAAVAGHSMGGYAALAFARAHPGRLLGLGLVSSQSLADTPERKTGRYQEAEGILARGVREVAEGMSVKLTAAPGLQARMKELILRQSPVGLADALRAMADRPDSTQLLSGFDLPLVLVHGLADTLIPIERARDVKTARPRAHLTEIPDAGHLAMMEAPQITAEALQKLTERVP
jgi:pimeloyl-ACP methyl ester carboxylesterase